jgi:hypothetical protein
MRRGLMSNYTIFIRRGMLYCKVAKNGSTYYVQSYDDFMTIIYRIMHSDYIVRIKGNSMQLKSKHYSCLINDFEKALSHIHSEKLANHIVKTIRENGFVDLTQKEKVDATVKRGTKFKDSLVKRVAIVALSAVITYSTIGTITYHLDKQKELTGYVVNSEMEDATIPDILALTDTTIQNEEIFDASIQSDAEDIIEEETIEEEIEQASEDAEVIPTVSLEFEDLSDTEKAINTKANYYDYIATSATKLGLDPELMLGIATQERGEHSSEIDEGGGIGLMQVQYSVWVNKNINYYELDAETGEFVKKSMTITDAMLRDVKTNIEIGCMIFQNCLLYEDYNIPLAIQAYNMGIGSVDKIIDKYTAASSKSREEIISSPEDLGWLEYRSGSYLENINKWIDINSFTVTNVLTGDEVSIEFTNQNEEELHSSIGF